MEKDKMITYLFDYACLSNLMIDNPDKSVKELFDKYVIENGICYYNTESEYYDVMRRTFTAYNIFRYYSIIEDFLLNRDDFISNNDLNGLESSFTIIEAPHDLINKKLIQYIRNAFNHNSDDVERFKMSANGRNFEINLRDTRTQKEKDNGVSPKPVRIKFNFGSLLKTIDKMSEKRQNTLYLSFDIPEDFDFNTDDLDNELDKIKFVHYYFPRKMDSSVTNRFDQLNDTKDLDEKELFERSDEVNAYASQINPPTVFNLDNDQKKCLKDMIEKFRIRIQPTKIEKYSHVCGYMFYFLSKVIPVPGLKITDIEQQIFLCGNYLLDTNLTYKEILNRLIKVVRNDPKPDYYDEIDCNIHDSLVNKGGSYPYRFLENMIDGSFTRLMPAITFVDAFVTHYYNESTIEIDGQIYDREKIRNSFVHQRWYIDKDYNICMYDADPRNINDYDLEFVGKINIGSFTQWAYNILNNKNVLKRTL
ncbi:MAG: hypothetical protein IKZ96_01580 [Bacilli bacterium]|nr:hypothetical protein [Bacilli bacterium]